MGLSRALFFMLSLVAVPAVVGAQAVPPFQQRLRVFIDCTVGGCDSDFFRTEITFVDHVRDRADAGVHVLITELGTGGGGSAYAMTLIPRAGTHVLADTVRFSAPQGATHDERRNLLARRIRLGLIPFVSHTQVVENLDVSVSKVSAATHIPAKPTHDPWNYWVYRIGTNSNFSGEKSQRFAYISGNTSANRTTEAWKISLRGNASYNESKFTFASGDRFANYSHTYGGSELVVRSVGPHWSVGQRASFGSSTYLNQKLNYRVGAAAEYNFFPYSEATRRQLTLQYSPGFSRYKYEERTIYGKLSESHPDHSLTTSLDLKQPWGSISSSLEGAALLDDFSKKRLVSFTSLNVRLFKGLNFNMYSSVSLVRDQLYIPGGNLSDEAVLVRRRQLESSYNYFGGIGISYTFGSVLNNVVNTRFGGSSGGMVFFN